MKYVNKLFGVFQRLHQSDEFEGTGIGSPRFSASYIAMGARFGPRGPLMEAQLFIFQLRNHKDNYGDNKQQVRPYFNG
jgi:light-regulated signal transduction histidine kinase (bacteriophytochrome)